VQLEMELEFICPQEFNRVDVITTAQYAVRSKQPHILEPNISKSNLAGTAAGRL